VERFTKITATLWVCAAIALQAWLLGGIANLPWFTLAAFLAGFILSRIDRRAIALVLLAAYVFPAILRLVHPRPSALFDVLWMGGLMGVLAPDGLRSRWHIPQPWRAPLVFALLATILSATLSIWREIDGTVPLLIDYGHTYWGGGNLPPFQTHWILNVSLILAIGILWFDWLCGARDLDFDRTIATPLIASVGLLSLVSAYQMFVDMRFLNETVFAGLHRASGTMYDANVSGAIAAMWIGGVFVWAARGRGWRLYVAPVAIAGCAVAVWASGSRTALTAATIVALSCIVSMVLSGRVLSRRRLALGFGAALIIVMLIMAVAWANPRGFNPGARLWSTVTAFPTAQDFLVEMWSRNGYGRSAAYLIGQHPLVGIGVGSFHSMGVPVAWKVFHSYTPPDNAQNWLRHQIVEFGWLGALGWILWMAAFAWYVVVPRRGEDPVTWAGRGVLVAFGLISLFGMPGQDLMVALTFWSLAYSFVHMKGTAAPDRPTSRLTWIAVASVLIAFAAGTAVVSATSLSLSTRAREAEAPFNYGFSYGFGLPDPAADGFRPTIRHAVALVEPGPQSWMAIEVRRVDAGSRPVDVRVWREGEAVLKGNLSGPGVLETYVPVTPLSKVLLEMRAGPNGWNRLSPFAIDSGVAVRWRFVDQPPIQFRHYGDRKDSDR
jgi:hypothetical protein